MLFTVAMVALLLRGPGTVALPETAAQGAFPVPPMPGGGAVRGAAAPLSFPVGTPTSARSIEEAS